MKRIALFIALTALMTALVIGDTAINQMADYMDTTKTCYRPVYETVTVADTCSYNSSSASTDCSGGYSYQGSITHWEAYQEDYRITCKEAIT